MRIAELLTEEHQLPLIAELLNHLMHQEKKVYLYVPINGKKQKNLISDCSRFREGQKDEVLRIVYYTGNHALRGWSILMNSVDELLEIVPSGDDFVLQFAQGVKSRAVGKGDIVSPIQLREEAELPLSLEMLNNSKKIVTIDVRLPGGGKMNGFFHDARLAGEINGVDFVEVAYIDPSSSHKKLFYLHRLDDFDDYFDVVDEEGRYLKLVNRHD